jgi:SAM-dependent methyltransferase
MHLLLSRRECGADPSINGAAVRPGRSAMIPRLLAGLTEELRCTACGADRSLRLEAAVQDEREVRKGTLTCSRCGATFDVDEGIVHLLEKPPETVTREAAGLQRFADRMRADGWDRERILRLPGEPSGYWRVQRVAFEKLMETTPLEAGARLLDVGSNTCWASNLLARRQLSVVALDIALTEMQGLRTAEWFLDDGCPHFERVLGSMFDLPFATGTFDYVFCCEVLHHNGRDTLGTTMREIHRVLRPGGRLLVVNEPLRFLTDLKRDHGQEVAEFEGNENVYFAPTYLRAARRAGFDVRVEDPMTMSFFQKPMGPTPPGASRLDRWKIAALRRIQRSPAGRRVYRTYCSLVRGEVSLNFVATKR